jgi:hypothetical protein
MSRDNSYTTRTNLLKSRTLAIFHKLNPTVREFKGIQGEDSQYISRHVGQQSYISQNVLGTRSINPACCDINIAPTQDTTCLLPDSVTNLVITLLGGGDPPDSILVNLSWDGSPNATSYTITSDHTILSITPISATSSDVVFDWPSPYTDVQFTVVANNTCGSSSGESGTIAPCFLAGSLIQMADGSTKCIEDIIIGDTILGAFGEINTVLALHRPLLGNYHMAYINGDHYTSAHHPHITIDKQFVCVEPTIVENETYGREHIIINSDGKEELRMLYGLLKGRVQPLTIGVELKGIHEGRLVESIQIVDMPSDTQLYNLVVSGSHTYFVDGYAVTGWPREDDFNYDIWTPR